MRKVPVMGVTGIYLQGCRDVPSAGQLCHWAVPALIIKVLQELLVYSFQAAICECEDLADACV